MATKTMFSEDQAAELATLGTLDGMNLVVILTDDEYEMDDDDPGSVMFAVKDILGDGFTAEWLDDYEPLSDGTTSVTIRISAKER